MPTQCPTCSKVNPADAVYCYYDGRALAQGSQQGPLALGTMPFPMPFCFPDGQNCANFNQLALACDERWNEARSLLADGFWQSFFTAMGRLDLATAAKQAAKEPDPDVGLTHLLEKFPADADALRPPKLGLPVAEQDLGTLEPGRDRKFELGIMNQGMLVLRGLVTTDCDWLAFGEQQGGLSSKMFQTRHQYTLPVRVLGDKLRAGRKPLEGQIVIDTNGGCITFPVRATVPIRPFPSGQYANEVLAGAKSPHELAVKAKAHPEEAGILFEQGAVKAWYKSNGWTYPIQGTEGTGKGAVQQFFEVLGLTKAPRLEINTPKIVCRGKVGERLTKHVTVSTKESRFVYAHGWSNHDWIQTGPTKSQGNTVVIPLSIEVPPRPGETVTAQVTIQGNGQQQFVVPVTLAVAEGTPLVEADFEPEERSRRLPLGWILGGVGALLLLVVGVVALAMNGTNEEDPPIVVTPPPPPPKKNEAWWDGIRDTRLAASVQALKESAPQEQAIFDGIAVKSQVERNHAYQNLVAKVPELVRNPKAKDPLGRLLVDCCVFEPSELNMPPLRGALTSLVSSQLPREGAAFRPEEKGEELRRGLWSLQVDFDAMTHPVMRPERARSLAHDLGTVFGFSLDASAPLNELKVQAQKLLAMRCYRNTLPTASLSLDHALAMRALLIEKYAEHLPLALRAKTDVDLIGVALSKGNEGWPKLEPILKACVENADFAIGAKVLDIYEQAKPELAKEMEKVLAIKWKAAVNPKLTHADKVAAVQKSLKSARIPPEERRNQLLKLTAFKPGQKKDTTSLLQDSVRLAHASTMACLLFREDGDLEGFDELASKVPQIEQSELAKTKQPNGKPKQPSMKGVIVIGPEPKIIQTQLTRNSERDIRGGFCKPYALWLKAGQLYNISLTSRGFISILRLESPDGDPLDVPRRGYSSRIFYPAPADGVYRVMVSSLGTAVGPYTLVIQQRAGFGFGNPFMLPRKGGPVIIPGGPMKLPGGKPDPEPPKTISKKDIIDLDSKQSPVRVAAFQRIADSVATAEMSPRYAKRIAAYLLSLKQDQGLELNDVEAKLEAFGKCRDVLLAMADFVARDDVAQQTAKTIVGGVLSQPLRFVKNEDWQTTCRRLLLERALEATASNNSGADQAGKILADLYKEQGLAFGIEDQELLALTRPTQVLHAVVKHVAAKAGKQKLAPNDQEYLEQIGRHLHVAEFVAENDLEHMVLLQRVWIKVLGLYLREKAPAEADAIMKIQLDLEAQDPRARNVLEQLRAGEEKIRQLWVQAYKLQ